MTRDMTPDMTPGTAFSDEQLTAYLDGEADPQLRRQIERARRRSPALEQQLKALKFDQSHLDTAFHGLLSEAPPRPQFLQPEDLDGKTPERRRNGWAVGLVAAGLMIISGIAGWLAAPQQELTWKRAAAIYHLLYVKDTLAHVAGDAAQNSANLRRLSAALGRPIKTVELNHVPGLQFKRGQLLGYQGRPLVQLAFMAADGTPIALCITPSKKRVSKDISSEKIAGINAAFWKKDGFEFLLLGKTAPEQLRSYSKDLHSRL